MKTRFDQTDDDLNSMEQVIEQILKRLEYLEQEDERVKDKREEYDISNLI